MTEVQALEKIATSIDVIGALFFVWIVLYTFDWVTRK